MNRRLTQLNQDVFDESAAENDARHAERYRCNGQSHPQRLSNEIADGEPQHVDPHSSGRGAERPRYACATLSMRDKDWRESSIQRPVRNRKTGAATSA